MTAFIRDGQLVDGPMSGLSNYDLSKLSGKQATELQGIINKSRDGDRLTADDVHKLAGIRQAATTTTDDPFAQLQASFDKVFGK
jgi:hypothetical protein